MDFKKFNLDDNLLEGLHAMNIKKPTPIQEKAIPEILNGRDLIGCAQTGTGKTIAYILPILQQLNHQNLNHSIDTLVVAPTRELAVQIDQQLEGLSYFTDATSLAVYGGGDGSAFNNEKKALSKGADIIIATPGRIITHFNLGYVKIQGLKHLILDEADRMLDMGFHEDILKIISYLPPERQTLLFSATMPAKIRSLAKKILKNPVEVNVAVSKPAEGIMQGAFNVYENQKLDLIQHILAAKSLSSVLVFSSTKSNVKKIKQALKDIVPGIEEMHSDLDQKQREKILNEFKHKKIKVLVATDVMSRGIDIENIELIINYDVPSDPEDYIHRIGRTARAESKGIAFTFVGERQQLDFKKISEMVGEEQINWLKLPKSMGKGPVFNPPKRRTGRGGRSKKYGRRKYN